MCGIFSILNYDGSFLSMETIQSAFDLGKARGPDNSKLNNIALKVMTGFHRLSINGLNNDSNQPININDIILLCNGEIYNHKQLRDLLLVDDNNTDSVLDDHPFETDSDCEIIIHLYKKFGMKQTLNLLDGVFSFILIDNRLSNDGAKAYIARDPYGVRPLFMMRFKKTIKNRDPIYCFASEMKMLIPIRNALQTKKNERASVEQELDVTNFSIEQFRPGHFSEFELPFLAISHWKYIRSIRYHTIPFNSTITESTSHSEEWLCSNLRNSLMNAVKKRVDNTDRPIACLLSGGLDSSLIASIVNEFHKEKFGKPVETYSIGLEGSEDLKFSNLAAEYLETKHTQIVITEEEFTNAIPEVVKGIESYDTTTVRASIGNWLVSKHISSVSQAKVIFNGDGADELMGGYLYFKQAGSPLEFHNECLRLLENIHYFDVLRSDRCISSHGLEARTPFLDRSFVQLYMSLNVNSRYSTKNIEKYLIRKSFDKQYYTTKDNKQLLPDEILWRRKEAFSDGVSALNRTTKDIINDYITKELNSLDLFKYHNNQEPEDETQWLNIALKLDYIMINISNYNLPTTKEQYYYRHLFEKHYTGTSNVIPYFWMPKYVNATDSSARTLAIYNETNSTD